MEDYRYLYITSIRCRKVLVYRLSVDGDVSCAAASFRSLSTDAETYDTREYDIDDFHRIKVDHPQVSEFFRKIVTAQSFNLVKPVPIRS